MKHTPRICLCGLLLLAGVVSSEARSKTGKMVFDRDTVLSSDVTIPAGTTCVIKPGVRLLFDGYYTLSVRGLIIAEGTAIKPIVISTVNRPTGSQKDPTWKGMEIIGPKANGQFKHCRIEGGYRNIIWESSPTFDSCEFSGNHYGLYCQKKAGPNVSGCTFSGNVYGIAIDYSYPLLLNNTITGNTVGIYMQLVPETIMGKNIIKGNQTNTLVEKAYSKDSAASNLQRMWNLMQQLY